MQQNAIAASSIEEAEHSKKKIKIEKEEQHNDVNISTDELKNYLTTISAKNEKENGEEISDNVNVEKTKRSFKTEGAEEEGYTIKKKSDAVEMPAVEDIAEEIDQLKQKFSKIENEIETRWDSTVNTEPINFLLEKFSFEGNQTIALLLKIPIDATTWSFNITPEDDFFMSSILLHFRVRYGGKKVGIVMNDKQGTWGKFFFFFLNILHVCFKLLLNFFRLLIFFIFFFENSKISTLHNNNNK
jgi:hypothetical protein